MPLEANMAAATPLEVIAGAIEEIVHHSSSRLSPSVSIIAIHSASTAEAPRPGVSNLAALASIEAYGDAALK